MDDQAFNKFIVAQVFSFIEKCVDMGYVYRNLSHQNILIARDG